MKSPELLGQKTLNPTLFHVFDFHIVFMYPNDPFGIPNFHVQPPTFSRSLLAKCILSLACSPNSSRTIGILGRVAQISQEITRLLLEDLAAAEERGSAQVGNTMLSLISSCPPRSLVLLLKNSVSMRRCPPKSFDSRMDLPHV